MSEELATVLFTDVEGSTDFRTRRGDDVAHHALRALHDTVTREIEHHGGRVVKSLGDGVLAVFRSPRGAVMSSVSIQREVASLNRSHPDNSLRVRIGINAGEVREENDDVFGEAVNAAARIAALASGGQVFASSVVRELVGTLSDVSFEDKGKHALKGFSEEWRLCEVQSQETQQLMLPDKTPFVGRETELAQLDRGLENALRGRGSVVLIGGEPGVGKTRLAEELALRAKRKDMLTFTGHCYEMEGTLPYSPFVEILESTAESIAPDLFREAMGDSAPELARFAPEIKKMFPDIPPAADMPAEEDRRYTFNSIGRYMRRSSGMNPVMLILDDLHWGDEATLLLFEHLALNLHDVPVLIVGTYRDVELAVSRPLSRTLESLVRQRAAQRLSLKRLTQQDVEAMLHRLSGSQPPDNVVAAIYAETEGNAFFVEEVFRHLLEEGKLLDQSGAWLSGLTLDELDVPEGVRLVIGRRLERLSDDTRKVLTVGAVMGRVFEFDLLGRIDDLTATDPLDAVDQAEAAHLIVPLRHGREARYSFVHELVRQTLLTDLSLPRRQRLHLQIADALEQLHRADVERYVPDLAHHLFQAGAAADPERTVRYLVGAGDRALATAASEEALRNYESALPLLEEGLDRAKLLYKIGRAWRGLRQSTEAQAAWEEALESAERLQETDLFLRTCLMIADRYTFVADWPRAIEILERGLRMPGSEASFYFGAVLALQSVAFAWQGRYAESRYRLEQSLAAAEKQGDPRLATGVLSARAIHHWAFGQFPESFEAGIQAAHVLRAAGATWQLANLLGHIQFGVGALGRWDEADEIYDELWPLATRIGHVGALLFARRWRETVAYQRDADLERTRRTAQEDLALALESDVPWAAESYAWLGTSSWLRGNPEEAIGYLEKGVEGAAEGAFEGWHLGLFMLGLAYSGQTAPLKQHLPRVQEIASIEGPKTIGQASLLSLGIEALVVGGDWDSVREFHGPAAKLLEQGWIWRVGYLLPMAMVVSLTAHAGGSTPEGEKYFQEALQVATKAGSPLAVADCKRLHAMALLDLGTSDDKPRAAELIDEAVSEYEDLGQSHLITVARALRERT